MPFFAAAGLGWSRGSASICACPAYTSGKTAPRWYVFVHLFEMTHASAFCTGQVIFCSLALHLTASSIQYCILIWGFLDPFWFSGPLLLNKWNLRYRQAEEYLNRASTVMVDIIKAFEAAHPGLARPETEAEVLFKVLLLAPCRESNLVRDRPVHHMSAADLVRNTRSTTRNVVVLKCNS